MFEAVLSGRYVALSLSKWEPAYIVSELVQSGRIADLLLTVIGLEAVLLVVLRRRLGRMAAFDMIPNLAAGAFLLLALKFALIDAGWVAIAACLAFAGLAHLADVRQRW